MSHRRARWSLPASLVGAWLALIQSPVYSQDYVEINDLDLLLNEPGRLERDLDNELDDIGENWNLGEFAPIAVLFDEIMWALGDEGDTDEEEEIDLYDLVQEMAESGASLEDVVLQALQEADIRASRQLPFGAAFVRVDQDDRTQRLLAVLLVKQRIVERTVRYR